MYYSYAQALYSGETWMNLGAAARALEHDDVGQLCQIPRPQQTDCKYMVITILGHASTCIHSALHNEVQLVPIRSWGTYQEVVLAATALESVSSAHTYEHPAQIIYGTVIMAVRQRTQRVGHTFNYDVTVSNVVNFESSSSWTGQIKQTNLLCFLFCSHPLHANV